MKTKLTIFIVLYASALLLAQPKPIYLTKAKIGTLDCSVQKKLADNSTLLVCIAFQNPGAETDIQSISFDLQNDSADISGFIKNLKNAITEIGNGANMKWDNDAYSIKTFDVASKVYLYEPPKNGDTHAEMNKSDVQKLVTWLEGILKSRGKLLMHQFAPAKNEMK